MKISLRIICLIILGLTFSVEAQNNIRIFDAESLDPLPFAHVKVTELKTDKSIQIVTDDQGNIEVPFLEGLCPKI